MYTAVYKNGVILLSWGSWVQIPPRPLQPVFFSRRGYSLFRDHQFSASGLLHRMWFKIKVALHARTHNIFCNEPSQHHRILGIHTSSVDSSETLSCLSLYVP